MMETYGLFLLALLSVSKGEIGCPAVNPKIMCFRADITCKSHSDCKPNEKCCPIPCGARCIAMDICLQPKVFGPLRSSFARFYYDPEAKQCKHFGYSGRGGNENNFKTKKECNEACKKSACLLPKEVGYCIDDTPTQRRFYYNKLTNQCEPFRYSGCQGNGNNFITKRACNRLCKNVQINPCGPDPICPVPPRPPVGSCPAKCVFEYEIINGVKCKVKCTLGPAPPPGPADQCEYTCPPIGPVDPVEPKHCRKGVPLKNATCGGPGTTGCPRGYYCESWPTCCEISCKFGKPHPTRNCPNLVAGPGCPPGYHGLAHPADAYCACCPDGETPGHCPPIPPVRPETCNDVCIGGTCINRCSSDETCPSREKCCFNGCIRTCQPAVNNKQ